MNDDDRFRPLPDYTRPEGNARVEKRPAEDELRGKVEEALERARQTGEWAPLAGGQRKLLDYIIAEAQTRARQVDESGGSSRLLRDFLDFLGNLSDFIGEA